MKPQNGIFLVFQKAHLRFYFSNFFYVQDQEEIQTWLFYFSYSLFLHRAPTQWVKSKGILFAFQLFFIYLGANIVVYVLGFF